MTAYEVVTVDDMDLPAAHEWAMVELSDRTLFIATKGSDATKIGPDAWAAYRMIAEGRHACRRVRLQSVS